GSQSWGPVQGKMICYGSVSVRRSGSSLAPDCRSRSMDVNDCAEFPEIYAGIRRAYGVEWAKRFVLVAPLMLDDATGPVHAAFVAGLRAHRAGASRAEEQAWATCQAHVRWLASSLVAEAEAILVSS
ncbi:MAG: hypothetical protein JWP95_106, partial [Actinotalea sp.]|nr:hypothetical protein [Actinotalea sp.]